MFLLLAYVGIIFWVGSDSALRIGGSDSARLIANLYHVPLYAGLAFWVLRAVSHGQGLAPAYGRRGTLTFLVSGTIAVLDELHQAFVPLRHASLGDLMLDLTGIALMLVVSGSGGQSS